MMKQRLALGSLVAFGLAACAAAQTSEQIAPAVTPAAPLVAAEPAPAPSGRSLFFKRCNGCHTIESGAPDDIGPNLFGVFGRGIASTNFAYSKMLSARGGNWDEKALDGFLTDPQGWAPGTFMKIKGVASAEDRLAIIEFLKTQK